MPRALLALLLACLLTAGVDARSVTGLGLESVASSGDCCPDTPAGPAAPEDDCCDVDLGLCCATGSVALVATPSPGLPLRPSVDADAWVPPPAALGTRATGPPPTPPPIG